MKAKTYYSLFLLPVICILWMVWVWLSYTPQPAPTPAPASPTASITPTKTAVPTVTPSPLPTNTPAPSWTPVPPTATQTPTPEDTPTVTLTAVPPSSTPAFYTVQWGDNLSDITQGLCGYERPFWMWAANKPRIKNPHVILPEWELTIPWPCPR